MVKPALYSVTADVKVKGKDLLMMLSDGRESNNFSGKRKATTIGQKFLFKASFTRQKVSI